MMKKYIFIIVLLFTLGLLAGCRDKSKDIKADITIVDLDITEVTFNILITDEDEKITGLIFLRLFNSAGNQVQEKEFDNLIDLVGVNFRQLDNAVTYTLKAYATVDKKSVLIGEKTFNLASQTQIEIKTADDFLNMKNNRAGNYVLSNDIDFTDVTFIPPFNASRQFSGTFEGNGFELRNIRISTAYAQTGVFGQISIGKVSNVNLKNISIGTLETPVSTSALARVGIIAGYVSSITGKIENVHVDGGSIYFESRYSATDSLVYVGGAVGELRGQMENVTLKNVTISMEATGFAGIRLGGVVGLMFEDATMKEVSADSLVELIYTGNNIRNRNLSINVGGIVGQNRAINRSRSVQNVYQTGDIDLRINFGTAEGTTSGSYSVSVGGLAGVTASSFYNAFYSGNIFVSHTKNDFESAVYKEFAIGGLFGIMNANLITSGALKVGGEMVVNVSDDVNVRPSLTIGKQIISANHQTGFYGVPHFMLNDDDITSNDTSTIIIDPIGFLITDWIKEQYQSLFPTS
jgi:hypothetical protein